MKKYVIPIIAVILILVLALAILPAPEPERCAICDSIPYHAPCLVNLATGEVGELTVYEPHPFHAGEIWEYQQGGTFSFLTVAGITGYRDTARWEAHISIPVDPNEYEEQYFCFSCRNLLLPYSNTGFILANLQVPSEPDVFFIQKDSQITVGCYKISISQEMSGEQHVTVMGLLDEDDFADHPPELD